MFCVGNLLEPLYIYPTCVQSESALHQVSQTSQLAVVLMSLLYAFCTAQRGILKLQVLSDSYMHS